MSEVCGIVARAFPQFAANVPTKLADPAAPLNGRWAHLDNSKSVKLMGRPFLSMEATVADTIASLIEQGHSTKQASERAMSVPAATAE
jgi:hypothetical protein